MLYDYMRVLSESEMTLIHAGALEILESVGMKIFDGESCAILKKAGCRVDEANFHVRFPKRMVNEAVDNLKSLYKKWAREGKNRYWTGDSEACFSPHTGIWRNFKVTTVPAMPNIIDLDNNSRRPVTGKDVQDSIRLADGLGRIDRIASPVQDQGIPPKLQPLMMAAELVKLVKAEKLGLVEVWTLKDLHYLLEIAEVVMGGKEELLKNPKLVGYVECRSPLCLDKNMAELFVEYVKRGFPMSLITMPNAGATAPATSCGVLTLGIAETLVGLVMGFAIDPEARLAMDVTPSLCDMKTGYYPNCGPDRWAVLAATNQLLREYYGCQTGMHVSFTDACFTGFQAGMEKAMGVLWAVVCGASRVGGIGKVGSAGVVGFSQVQLVLDCELVEQVRRCVAGFEISPRTQALNVIKEVGIGGEYLSLEHTAENFRKEFWLSPLIERLSWDSWQKEEHKGMEEKAREKARKILKEHHPRPLSDGQMQAIDQIVQKAKTDIMRE